MRMMHKEQPLDLTIVIPTYNRSQHLKRLLSYCSREENKIVKKIFILDSSDNATKKINQTLVQDCNLDITYFDFEHSINVASKIYLGLSSCETEFSMICADDDIMFFDCLEKAVNILRNETSVAVVDGKYLNFASVNGGLSLTTEYVRPSIDYSNASSRLFSLVERYESLFYGVYRSSTHIKIFGVVEKIDSLHYQELCQTFCALTLGKHVRMDDIFCGRQHTEAAEPDRTNWQTYYWFNENPKEFLQHYKTYEATIADFLKSELSDISDEGAEQLIRSMHALFFANHFPKFYFLDKVNENMPEHHKIAKQVFDTDSQLKLYQLSNILKRIKTLGFNIQKYVDKRQKMHYTKHLEAVVSNIKHERENIKIEWTTDIVEFVAHEQLRGRIIQILDYLEG